MLSTFHRLRFRQLASDLSSPANPIRRTSTIALRDRKMSSRPVNLVSVNTAPDRAKKVIGQVVENVKDKYTIVHAGNTTTIEGVKPLLLSVHPPPGILFCASMWTPQQQEEIQQIARDTIPGIRTHAIPTGLQVQVGPDGVVNYLMERIDDIMHAQ